MAERYTRKDAELCAKHLAEALGKSFGNCWKMEDGKLKSEIGCWDLDFNALYGGGVIFEIMNEAGGIDHPVGSGRLKPSEFCQAVSMAIDAIGISKKERKQ